MKNKYRQILIFKFISNFAVFAISLDHMKDT